MTGECGGRLGSAPHEHMSAGEVLIGTVNHCGPCFSIVAGGSPVFYSLTRAVETVFLLFSVSKRVFFSAMFAFVWSFRFRCNATDRLKGHGKWHVDDRSIQKHPPLFPSLTSKGAYQRVPNEHYSGKMSPLLSDRNRSGKNFSLRQIYMIQGKDLRVQWQACMFFFLNILTTLFLLIKSMAKSKPNIDHRICQKTGIIKLIVSLLFRELSSSLLKPGPNHLSCNVLILQAFKMKGIFSARRKSHRLTMTQKSN